MKEFKEILGILMVNLSKEEENKLQSEPLVHCDNKVWCSASSWLCLKGIPVNDVSIIDSDYIKDEEGSYQRIILEKPILNICIGKIWKGEYHDIITSLFGNYRIEATDDIDEDGDTIGYELEIKVVLSDV